MPSVRGRRPRRLSPEEKKSLTHGDFWIPEEEREVYRRALQALNGASVPFVVAGAGGYTKLGKIHQINGKYPRAPLKLNDTLSLEQYDQNNFGFLRIELSRNLITGTYLSAPYIAGANSPVGKLLESFEIDRQKYTVRTL